ncbi:MAG: metal-dependent hydrolase [Cellulomonadaceae bacterium]|nr:metal-dependent hydrolase [Cellulomonadaceae bacterium]
MMGKHHAVSGAAAWVAVTSTAPFTLGLAPLPRASVLIGTACTAGAALLLDSDHHSSTFARSGGAVTRVIATAAEGLSGGHRHGLHSLPAVAALTVGTAFVGRWFTVVPYLGRIPAGSALVFLVLVALMMKVIGLQRRGIVALWVSAAILVLGVLRFAPEEMAWLPLSVLIGSIVHLLGDALTTAGIPLLWPWVPEPPELWSDTPVLNAIWKSNGYMAVPILGDAGSTRETVLFVAMSLYTVYALLATTGALAAIA